MNEDNEESTPRFIACLAAYLIFGFAIKAAANSNGPLRWYHYLVFAPFAIFALYMQIYPAIYIKAKLRKWGMFEDKADTVAGIFWIACLILWCLVFL